MPSRYAAEGSVGTAGDTSLAMIGSATVRGGIYYVAMGSESAPADATIVAALKTITLDGTGTPVTPQPIDAGDRAASVTANQTYTAEPTYSGIPLLNITMNQRSHYQFYAQEGGEFWSNLAAGDGYGMQIQSFSTGTPTMSTVFHWRE